MLTERQRHAASDMLWDLWQQGLRIAALPTQIRPTTREEGYAVQALLEGRSAHPQYGWKIAATSLAGQRHIGVDGPLAGRLLRERVCNSGAELALGANHMKVAEPEFAFRMGQTLPPRASAYVVDEVMAAVDTLHQRSSCPTRATTTSRGPGPRSSSPTTRAPTTLCWGPRRRSGGGPKNWLSTR